MDLQNPSYKYPFFVAKEIRQCQVSIKAAINQVVLFQATMSAALPSVTISVTGVYPEHEIIIIGDNNTVPFAVNYINDKIYLYK